MAVIIVCVRSYSTFVDARSRLLDPSRPWNVWVLVRNGRATLLFTYIEESVTLDDLAEVLRIQRLAASDTEHTLLGVR